MNTRGASTQIGNNLNHGPFQEWAVIEYALETERRQIERCKATIDDEFCSSPSNRRGLLEAVTGEAIHDNQIGHIRNQPDDRVVVECVDIVVAGPSTNTLDGFKRGHAMGQRWPDHLVKLTVVHFEVVAGLP